MAKLRFELGIVLTVVLAQSVAANPTSNDPDALLAVRPQDTSTELAVQAGVLLRGATDDVTRYEQNVATGKYKAGDAREMKNIGLTHNQVTQVDRIGSHLRALGEPAGVDLQLRAAELHRRLQTLIVAYRKLPNASQLITNSVVQVENIVKSKQRGVARLGEFFKQGKIEQAEKGINDIYDELEPLMVWHTVAAVQSKAYDPFRAAKSAIDKKAKEMREEQGQQLLEEMRTAQDPGFAALLAQVKTAGESVGRSGKAMWDGKELDGPALLLAWGQSWREVQAKTMRCRAIDWARGIKAGVRPPSELDQLEMAYGQFEEQMTAAMSGLVAAEAGRAFPDAIPTLYIQYLDALATLAPQVASEDWFIAMEEALAGLRDKSPLLAKEVASYDEATREVLRWRKRAAAAAAKARAKDAPPLEEVWKKAAETSAMIDRKAANPNSKQVLTYLTTGAPPLVRDVDRVTKAKLASVAHLAPSTDGAVSRYRNRLAARVGDVRLPAAEIEQLRKDLLVGPSDPPLTLTAAAAIKSAEQGYLSAAGGEVTGLHLESLLVHFILLSDVAPHLALGPIPEDLPAEGPGESVEQVTCWFELKPQWLQHEYVFVELP